MPRLDAVAYTQPKTGSDFAFAVLNATDDPPRSVVGAIDTIGELHQRFGVLRKFVIRFENMLRDMLDDPASGDLETLDRMIRERVLALNQEVAGLFRRRDKGVSGFCMAMACMVGHRCSAIWVGDSRAYRIGLRPDPETGRPRVETKALTTDQNGLATRLEGKERHIFLRGELQELSKRLVCYWGHPNDERVAQTLREERSVADLLPGDVALAMTDGIYLPIIRSILYQQNFIMNLRDFYLEDWLSNFMQSRGYFDPDGPDWKSLSTDLIRHVLKYTSVKRRYRDSIAIGCIHAMRD